MPTLKPRQDYAGYPGDQNGDLYAYSLIKIISDSQSCPNAASGDYEIIEKKTLSYDSSNGYYEVDTTSDQFFSKGYSFSALKTIAHTKYVQLPISNLVISKVNPKLLQMTSLQFLRPFK